MHSFQRRRMARLLLIVLTLSLLVSGCTLRENADRDEDIQNNQPRYAVLLRALSDPAEETVKQGIEAKAESLGVTVDIFAPETADDADEQLRLLEQCIEAGYLAIGISPIAEESLAEGVAKAYKKGIYIVNLEKEIDLRSLSSAEGSITAFVAADPMQDGANAAYYILSKLTAGGDVALLTSSADAVCEARRLGAEENFRTASGVRLVEICEAGGDEELAYTVTADLLQKYPHLQAIYACNDAMALGAVRAAEEGGKLNTLLIVGSDGTAEALASIHAGKLSATVAVDWAQIGAAALGKMVEAARAEASEDAKTEPETISVTSYIAEKESD